MQIWRQSSVQWGQYDKPPKQTRRRGELSVDISPLAPLSTNAPAARAVLAEWGTQIPDDAEICVVDSTADYRRMVPPMRPKGTEGWSVEKRAAIITRDALVGVAVPRLQGLGLS